jgi:hypothetical protein
MPFSGLDEFLKFLLLCLFEFLFDELFGVCVLWDLAEGCFDVENVHWVNIGLLSVLYCLDLAH